MAQRSVPGDEAAGWEPASASFSLERVRGCAVLVAGGEIDLSTSLAFQEALVEAAQASDRVILDLSGLSFLDSTGMRMMVKALHRNDTRPPGALCLVGPAGLVLTALSVTRLTELFEIYASVDEAVEHLG